MAGTELAAEGLPSFRVSTLTAAASSAANSLEAGFATDTLTNGAVVYVVAEDDEYRWFATSTATPASPEVIIPLGQNPAVPGRWILIAEPEPPVSADFVIDSNATLEELFPAVGGVHEFDQDGVYLFTGAGFSMGSDSIEVTADNVVIRGQGRTVISSALDGPVVLATGTGDARMVDITIENTDNTGFSGAAVQWQSTGTLLVDRCSFLAVTAAGLWAWDGSCRVAQSRLSGFLGLDVLGGDQDLFNCNLSPSDPTGVGILDANTTGGDLTAAGCQINNASVGISVSGGTSVGTIMLSNIRSSTISGAWLEQAGTIPLFAAIDGCYSDSGTVGVDWPAATIPTNGLYLNNCSFMAGDAILNFTETSSRVYLRAIRRGAGSVTETPLTP